MREAICASSTGCVGMGNGDVCFCHGCGIFYCMYCLYGFVDISDTSIVTNILLFTLFIHLLGVLSCAVGSI